MRKLKDFKLNVSEEELALRLYESFKPVIQNSTFSGLNIDKLSLCLGCKFLGITVDEYNSLKSSKPLNSFSTF